MNIVFIAHFAGSPKHGMVNAYYYLSKEWLKRGHQVSIITAGCAHTRNIQPHLTGRVTEEWIDDIRYLWLKTTQYSSTNWVGRILNILSFSYQAFFSPFQFESIDVVICSSHHPLAIFAAEKMARKYNAKLIFEVRDIWPLTLIELSGVSRLNPFIALLQYAEDRAYKKSDKVISVLSHSYLHMQDRGMVREKFCFIPNGFLMNKVESKSLPDGHVRRLEEMKHSDSFIVGYAGRLTLANALQYLIEALSYTKSNIQLAILGDGPCKSELVGLVKELGLEDSVIFFDAVKKDQVPMFLEYVDVCYVGFLDKALYRFGVSPTKLNDYMAASKPVICAINSPDSTLADANCGIECAPENSRMLARILDDLSSLDSKDLIYMGERGFKWLSSNRDYSQLANKFLQAMRS